MRSACQARFATVDLRLFVAVNGRAMNHAPAAATYRVPLFLVCRHSHMPPSDSAPPIRWMMLGASPRKMIDSTALTIGPR